MSGLMQRIMEWLAPVHASVSNTAMKKGSVNLARQGSIVTMTSVGDIISLTRGAWVTYVTIPEGFRPANTVYCNIIGRETLTAKTMNCVVQPSGLMQFYLGGNSNITSAENCRVNGVWSTV